jgi:hypothetical protein
MSIVLRWQTLLASQQPLTQVSEHGRVHTEGPLGGVNMHE